VTDSSQFAGTILAVVTRSLLQVAESKGLPGDELLAAAGLVRADIASPDAYLPIERHVALGVAMTERMGRVNGGLHSGVAIFGDPRGALGFAIRRSGVHGRALTQFARFLSIINDSLRLSVQPAAEGVSVCVEMVPSLEALGHPTEALFSAWVSIARFATGVRWAPERVLFRHAPWGPASEHREFFACPVEFGAPRSELVIGSANLLLAIEPKAHPFDAVVDRLERHLLTAAAAPRAAVIALTAALRAGPLATGAGHPPALLIDAARFASEAALPAFETAFLLGFAGVRELAAELGR